MALRWGIASAGKISHDFLTGLGTLSAEDHKVVAVGARDLGRAKDFAKLHEIRKAYGSYDELAKDPEVEIVYIGALNPQHYEIGMLMLNNGKHVLCEKPLCMNEKQAKKLLDFAEQKKLFLMEAVWSRYFPSYQYVRKQIENGVLGEIKEVRVPFGFDLTNVDRLTKKTMGGGTVLDLGVYTIQVSQWAFREPPKSIKATGELNEEGCDLAMKAELTYPNGGKSFIETSAKSVLDNTATIIGTKGQITIKQFWCSETIIDVDGKEKTWALPKGKHKTNFINSEGLRYEAEEVRKCIRDGRTESESMSHNESLVIARIQDEIRKQIGVVFEEDKL
ncbi:unnamed protein product [Hermetia illucens]|uniref:Trans-1,2-dihydrobenzene-1,2-diol dehydrogenase n=1 Tax=Hermetia illucens TaxID=343691 RepID=A0A7R8US61_HERIL|nr:trans-1,2-dihydrobenzene-1,2-diol dehydrogenase-like [Hermetia illucens]CAD7085588.1 unnamed protein product [Hermetia illucens]